MNIRIRKMELYFKALKQIQSMRILHEHGVLTQEQHELKMDEIDYDLILWGNKHFWKRKGG
jgi:hypothetical protein